MITIVTAAVEGLTSSICVVSDVLAHLIIALPDNWYFVSPVVPTVADITFEAE